MKKRIWPLVFVWIAAGCGDRAEFQTVTEKAPAVPAVSEDVEESEDGGFTEEEVADDGGSKGSGNGKEDSSSTKKCDVLPALPANCELTTDLQILCRDVTMTTTKRIDGEWVWAANQ